METNRNFRYSKTNKSEQFTDLTNKHLSKNADSGSEDSSISQRQSSMKNPGLHQRRFLLHMEKLRSMHEKKKTVEKRRKSLMPMLGGFRELKCEKLRRQKSNKNNTVTINVHKQPTLKRDSTGRIGCQDSPSIRITTAKKANEEHETSGALFLEVTPEHSASSLTRSKKRIEEERGVKYEYNLDLQNQTDTDSEQESNLGFHSQNTTFVHNVKQTYSYESRREVQTFATRLREFKSYNRKLILPDDPWKIKWNFFLLMIILFSSVTTPLRATFYDDDELVWQLIDGFIDLVFVLDIIFTFFSAYYNKIEQLISNRRDICCNYLKSWFILDLISVLPFSYFFNSSANQFGKLAKLPRIFQIIKTTKFVRILKVIKARKSISRHIAKQSMNNLEMERIMLFFFIFGILCHSLACLWFLVAKLQDFDLSTWVARYEYLDSPVSEQYLASLYFIVTTITTVGYGDITSKNPSEQVFCIILMLIGVIAYSMAISSFSNIMSLSDQKSKTLLNKLHVLSRLRDYYDLSFEFYWRLRQSLHYDHEMDMSEKLSFVRELPPKLQVELSNIMYSHQLGGIRFFKKKSPQFIAALAPKLKPLKVCKGDYLFLKGDPLDGIYFIQKGEAAYVERRPRADLIFATNKSGSYFGDIDFAVINEKLEPKRLFTVKAKTDMDLLLLEKEDLYSIDNEFKKEIFSLFQNSLSHLEKLKTMNRRSSQWLKRRLNVADPNYGIVNEEEEDQYSLDHIPPLSHEICEIPSNYTPSEGTKFTSDTLGSFFSTKNQGGNILRKELQLRQRSFLLKRDRKKNSRIARVATKYCTSAHLGQGLGNIQNCFRTESALQDQQPLRKSRFQKLQQNNYLSDNGDYGSEYFNFSSRQSEKSSPNMSEKSSPSDKSSQRSSRRSSHKSRQKSCLKQSEGEKSFTSSLMLEELE